MNAATPAADLILHSGRITTLDRRLPEAAAVAIGGGRFLAVGRDEDVMALAGADTRRIDLGGRRVLPGLIDNHLHLIRGGLHFNLELRWDGVRSLADAMAMLRHQVAITPPPQWVRVVGGFTEHQFAEKRLPSIDELNAVAPDTPVFLLHLYDRALLNAAALRAVGYTKQTPEPPGGEIVRDGAGNPVGLLLAKPNAAILYATLAKGPKLPFDYQLNSTRHFMRELNRLGVTGAIDAGGGFQNYPEDYAVIEKLAADGQLTIRLAYNLFTQKPKQEKDDFLNWTRTSTYKQGDDYFRHNGAGEMLVFSAADFEDFRQPRPDMPPQMESELEDVVRILAGNRWPWRMHATYDETISRALDVFERVDRDVPLRGLNWFFDHAETVSERSIDRIAALGGGIAVQHRMAYQGEYFVERYGAAAAQATPPVARMLEKGVRVSAGTDATRVASYNPWVSLALADHRPDRRRARPLPAAQLPGPRHRAAHVDGERHLVLQRGRPERPHPGGPAGRPDRAGPRLLRLRRRRHRRHDVAADDRRRTRRPRRRRFRAAGRSPGTAGDAGLVARAHLRWLRRVGAGACDGGAGRARRRRSCLRDSRPRSRGGLVGCAAGGRSEIVLGRARLRVLGDMSVLFVQRLAARFCVPAVHWLALLALCAAYLQGGVQKAWDFGAATAEAAHFGLAPAAPVAFATIVLELGASLMILLRLHRWLGAAAAGRLHARGDLHRQPLLDTADAGALHGHECVLRAPRADRRVRSRRLARPARARGKRRSEVRERDRPSAMTREETSMHARTPFPTLVLRFAAATAATLTMIAAAPARRPASRRR